MALPDMKIGALTACAPTLSLEDWMKEGKRIGLDGFEVAEFRSAELGARKDYVATTLNLAEEPMTADRARQIVEMSKDYGIEIFALGSYENALHPVTGGLNQRHLMKVIDAAAKLEDAMPGRARVATFVGADPNLRMDDNYEKFVNDFLPIVAYAREKGVEIMVENCPMEGWEPGDRPVNQLMSSPRYWEACFEAAYEAGVGDALGLEYDPSHRIWQLAGRMHLVKRDVETFGSEGKIFALHGKGAECLDEGLWLDGIDGRLLSLEDNEWGKRTNYEHAVPGVDYDSVQWDQLIPLARKAAIPFVSIEIEDPKYKDMEDPVRNGELGIQAIEIARKNLMPLCYTNGETYQAPTK